MGGYTRTVRLHMPAYHRRRYMVAANHQSKLDPFAIMAMLPLKQKVLLAPMKFPTWPRYYHSWRKPFMYLLGCYPAHSKERRHRTSGVEGTVKLLDYGYNICIFPEGTRTTREASEAKSGICRMLAARPDTILLLAHIEWQQVGKGKLQRHATIVIAPAPEWLDKTNPKAIMDAIYAL